MIVVAPYLHGNFLKPRKFCRARAALTGDDKKVFFACGFDNDRLHDAVLFDRRSEFFEQGLIEFFAGLAGIRL